MQGSAAGCRMRLFETRCRAKAQFGWHICHVLDTITSMSTALGHRPAGSVKPGTVIGRLPAESFLHVHELPGSPSATAAAVSRAAKDGILTRIRHGLYFKGRPTRYGPTRPTPEAVAREVLGNQGVGPAGFSAARALGVTTQIPARPEFAIAGPKPTGLQGVQVHQRSNMARRNLSYLEIALLEVLRDPKTLVEGSWSHLVDAVRPAVSSGKVNMTRLQKAAAHEGSLSARSSLHRLLADLAADQ